MAEIAATVTHVEKRDGTTKITLKVDSINASTLRSIDLAKINCCNGRKLVASIAELYDKETSTCAGIEFRLITLTKAVPVMNEGCASDEQRMVQREAFFQVDKYEITITNAETGESTVTEVHLLPCWVDIVNHIVNRPHGKMQKLHIDATITGGRITGHVTRFNIDMVCCNGGYCPDLALIGQAISKDGFQMVSALTQLCEKHVSYLTLLIHDQLILITLKIPAEEGFINRDLFHNRETYGFQLVSTRESRIYHAALYPREQQDINSMIEQSIAPIETTCQNCGKIKRIY
jgi:hypothetical protein